MESWTLRLLLAAGTFLIVALCSAAPKAPAPSRGLLLVANKGDHTLGIIDPVDGKEIATVDEGGITGHEVAASPDGRRAFVPIYGNSGVGSPGTDGQNIAVIDLANHKLIDTLNLGKPLRPHCAVFGPQNGLLYVTTELGDSVTIIDPSSLHILGSVPTGQPESHMLAISHDGKRGYTANVHAGTVSVLDLEARQTLTVIHVSRQTQRIALSVDDRWVFTADQTQPQIAVIDTSTNTVTKWIPLEGLAYGTGATLDGKWLLVTLPKPGKVAVVDLSTMSVVRSVDVPKAPQEVLVRPDNQVAYVSCDTSKKVAAINLQTWSVQLIDAGRSADGLAWANGQ
ncbi:MAG: cytochrome D1 domain-containing protein [Terriglobia bacterium]|jgi:DNA-binding beta-propeller fold protein YncE